MEIEAFIASELERNPLLELGRDAVPADSPSPEEDRSDAAAQQGDPRSDAAFAAETPPRENPLDIDPADGGSDDEPPRTAPGQRMSDEMATGGRFDEDGPDFDRFAEGGASLYEHLMDQARARLSGADLIVATQLIGQIDEAGYLEADLLQTAYALGTSRAHAEEVLAVIQGFDPVGVGARTLAECLELQAREADRYDPAMERLIANLDLLARGAIPQLRRICGVDEEDMADMIRELRAYDPKPGLRFSTEQTVTVTPDLFVTRTGDGWAIEINSATLPRLLVNRRYYTQVSSGTQDKAARAWLSECLAEANWLIKALDQRQRTIVKVAGEIVRRQEAFFQRGVSGLKPLTLRSVAEAIGMHESTVSRVTSNKYLACERGIYELKYFFTSGIASGGDGEAVSAEAVKDRIKALIAAENPAKILSDDTLVEMLRAEGFDIARRTVAKYREAMGIGSSVQRRRQKALTG